MGQLIICRIRAADKPFFLKSAKLNIYSLEELFYYLYNATFVDKSELMCDEFIHWVRDDLSQPDLSGQLYESSMSGKGLLDYVMKLEACCGYLSENELKQLNINLNRFDHMSPLELGKQSADDLLKKGRFMAAINAYKRLLMTDLFGKADDVVKGDIYHNMGVAYSRFFDFGEAKNCFIRAYRSNHRQESLAEAVDCAVISQDKEMLDDIITTFNASFSLIEREVKRATAVHTDSLSKAGEMPSVSKEELLRRYIYSSGV